VFIQVRLGSTRLPRKALLPLAGAPIVSHVMRALSAIPAEVKALLTDPQSAPDLAPAAEAEGYSLFIGHPLDVLERYCGACRRYDVRRVVRATGDNPLTSGDLAARILALHGRRNADLSHFLGIPWGSGVEVVQASALLAAEREASAPEEREHITTFLYRHPERFAIVEEQAPAGTESPEARVTVDTMEDYERVTEIYRALYRGAPIEVKALVSWFAGRARRGAEGV
jgi:spore coat polysaccharide biosynthesis protein SpsF